MKKIQHLYWRAGFGLSPKEWQKKQHWSIQQATADLFEKAEKITQITTAENTTASLRNKNLSKTERQAMRQEEKKRTKGQNIAWIELMSKPESSDLIERMSLFWHGHFACETKIAYLAAQQINTIRQYALGNFRELVVAIAKDPAMIYYLNNQQNKKRTPNENFARELMELFTIGRGNYTEKDVKEAARAFTGWSSTLTGDYIFIEEQHDFAQKTFMGKTGNFNGEDIIDLILQKQETATFIARKIYVYFVNEKVNERRVKELADLFYRSNYNIKSLMQHIFNADWFYEKEQIGTKIKSPIELIVGMTRQLGMVASNPKAVVLVQKALGQILFNPPNVAGWPGGKIWIDNSTLMLRLNLANMVFKASELDFKVKDTLEGEEGNRLKVFEASLDLQALAELTQKQEEAAAFNTLSDFLLQTSPRITASEIQEFTKHTHRIDLVKALTLRLLSLPEYQMC